MTDETEQPESDVPALGDVGAWLKAGRKAKGLTVDAVASALHLDTPIVEALEREDFAAIGATVFVKGHLRAVAQHLGLDIEEAAERFHGTAGAAAVQPPELIVSYNKPALRQNDHRLMLIWAAAALVLVVIVLLAWMLWPTSSPPPAAQPGPAVVTPEPVSDDSELVLDETLEPVEPTSTTASGEPGTDFEAMLESARNNSALTASVATVTERGLRMNFTAECWYEIRDANGDRLAMGTARPGTSRLVTGTRPLAVTLGVADAVTLQLDGAPLAITSADRRGRAARLTIR